MSAQALQMSGTDLDGGDRIAGMRSTVTFEDRTSGKRQTFELVPPGEGHPADGKLSIESPVGQALRGLSVGALAHVHTPTGTRDLTVVAVA